MKKYIFRAKGSTRRVKKERNEKMIQKPKGTKDILPQDSYKWQYIEEKSKELFANYGFKEIRVPVLKIQSFFKEALGKLQMLYKKRCILLRIKAGEV